MFLRPFEHERQCSPTQMPLENLQRSDVDQRFVFCIQRMKVRRSTIFPEHLNQDAISAGLPSTSRTRRVMTSKRLPSGTPPPGGRTATERSCKLPV